MTIDTIHIDDIFRASWGHEQTNVDHYKVTRKTAKMIELQQIGTQSCGDTGWASDRCKADPVVEIGQPFMRRPSFYGHGAQCYVRIDTVSVASKVDPDSTAHRSWYA